MADAVTHSRFSSPVELDRAASGAPLGASTERSTYLRPIGSLRASHGSAGRCRLSVSR
jgi:hypothetical protein